MKDRSNIADPAGTGRAPAGERCPPMRPTLQSSSNARAIRRTATSPRSVALRLAKAARRNPRELAQSIVAALAGQSDLDREDRSGWCRASSISISRPQRTQRARTRSLPTASAMDAPASAPARECWWNSCRRIPTGPLHVGHGRHAAYRRDARQPARRRWRVHREYYVNDAGRQMDILAVSVWLRYLELCGERFEFPSNGYRGEYIAPIAQKLLERRGRPPAAPGRRGASRPAARRAAGRQGHVHRCGDRARARAARGTELRRVLDLALEVILGDIREDLAEFGVTFDEWFSERSLADKRRHRARARAPQGERARLLEGWRAVVPGHRLRRREGSRGGAREWPEDLLRFRYRLPPLQARARLRAADRRARRRSSRLRDARARGPRAMGEPGECLEVG